MRKILSVLLSICLLFLCSCSSVDSNSTFEITFIDVGQGDSALIECDGQFMLIDGGDETAQNKVYNILEGKRVKKLEILAISHLHEDHYAGLIKPLSYAQTENHTISNKTYVDNKIFRELERQLQINKAKITVPHEGDKFKLGSAEVEVVDVSAEKNNDSLVLLITYGNTRFLFTGDIEDEAQTRISNKYQKESDEPFEIDLIKMPHHGSASPHSVDGTGSLYRFLRTFKTESKPQYAIISVGSGNRYGHPHRETLDLLKDADYKVYRTDLNGDILVRSDGETLSIETSR